MNRITVVAILVVAILVAVILAVLIVDQKINMRHFFDDWDSETNEKVVHILEQSYIFGESRLELPKYVDGLIEEIYCLKNQRVYFCYSTAIPDSYPDREWHIASIGLTGKDLIEHYGGNLFDEPNPLGYRYPYESLACHPYDEKNMAAFIQITKYIFMVKARPSLWMLN